MSYRTRQTDSLKTEADRDLAAMMDRQARAIRRLACEQCKRELRRGPRNAGDFGDGSGDYIGDRVPRPIQDQERTPLNVTGNAVGDYRIAR